MTPDLRATDEQRSCQQLSFFLSWNSEQKNKTNSHVGNYGWQETDSIWFPRDANEDTLVEYRIIPPKSYREDGCYLGTV